jgi:hypothetical protein
MKTPWTDPRVMPLTCAGKHIKAANHRHRRLPIDQDRATLSGGTITDWHPKKQSPRSGTTATAGLDARHLGVSAAAP